MYSTIIDICFYAIYTIMKTNCAFLVLSLSSAYNRNRKFYRNFSLARMCILQTVSIIVIKELKEKRGIIMYQTLWNSINKQVKASHASAAFLAVSLIGWTTIGLLAGFLICMIGGMSFVTKITVVLCSGGYTGLIFGFFGGILYLYRSEPRHLTDAIPSQVSTTSKISLNAKTAAR